MCGIVYVKREDGLPANKMIIKRYQEQKKRGNEGFGYVAIEDGYIKDVKRATTEAEIIRLLEKEKSSEILFHHRYPTSTENYSEVTHPIVVDNKDLKHVYHVVHNGVLQNEEELKKEHNKLGFDYTTEFVEKQITVFRDYQYESETTFYNDSEALAIEIALFSEDKKKTIEADGTIAFIAIQSERDGKVTAILFGRNYGNPLVREETKDFICIRSEGKGDNVMAHELNCFNRITGEQYFTDIDIGKVAPVKKSVGYGYQDMIDFPLYNDDIEDDMQSGYVEYYQQELERKLSSVEEQIISTQSDIEEVKKLIGKSSDSEKSAWEQELKEMEEDLLSLDIEREGIDSEICDILCGFVPSISY